MTTEHMVRQCFCRGCFQNQGNCQTSQTCERRGLMIANYIVRIVNIENEQQEKRDQKRLQWL